MPWVKGQSGNPKGRPPRLKIITDHLTKMLAEVDGDETKGEKVAKILLEKALAGEDPAMRLLLNYSDGMPLQRQEVSGEEGGAIVIVRHTASEDAG